uniref:Uncharacterized protein n=1 Tax=Acrobeloides nanus TaxID=290746 RepID=A0A914DYL9_9BILA
MDHPPPPHDGPPPSGFGGGPPPDGFGGGPPPGVPGGPNGNTTVPPELRLLGASSYLVFTLLSLTANFLLLAVFIKVIRFLYLLKYSILGS